MAWSLVKRGLRARVVTTTSRDAPRSVTPPERPTEMGERCRSFTTEIVLQKMSMCATWRRSDEFLKDDSPTASSIHCTDVPNYCVTRRNGLELATRTTAHHCKSLRSSGRPLFCGPPRNRHRGIRGLARHITRRRRNIFCGCRRQPRRTDNQKSGWRTRHCRADRLRPHCGHNSAPRRYPRRRCGHRFTLPRIMPAPWSSGARRIRFAAAVPGRTALSHTVTDARRSGEPELG